MSMILDALRRADSERERGAVPGLHAQPVAPPAMEVTAKRRAQPWHWVAIGLLVATTVSLAGFIAGRESPRQVAEVAIREVPPAASAPAVMPAPSRESSAPVAPAAPWPQPESRMPVKPTTAPSEAPGGSAPEFSTNAAPSEATIQSREQLPEQIRATLPQIAIGGSMYSTNPANRSLIVNGGLYRENDSIGADLLLEQIKLRAAVFRFKGYRFEIQF